MFTDPFYFLHFSLLNSPFYCQYLEEDPRTNRIDDSLQLFTAICSNKLLKNSHLVLLLNKVGFSYLPPALKLWSDFFTYIGRSLEEEAGSRQQSSEIVRPLHPVLLTHLYYYLVDTQRI